MSRSAPFACTQFQASHNRFDKPLRLELGMIGDQLANEHEVVFGDLPVSVAQGRLHAPQGKPTGVGTQVENAGTQVAKMHITLTEISLEDVCQRIEDAEREHEMGLHGGWAGAAKNKAAVTLVPNGPILLVARCVESEQGLIFKWVQVEVIN
jgi:hypothetical protein